MNKIVLVGGGGHCKSVIDSIDKSYFTDIVITDCGLAVGSTVQGIPIIGDDEMLPVLYSDGYKQVLITIASINSTDIRRNVWNKINKIGFFFPTIIDSSAKVSETAHIEEGVFVGKNVAINAEANIGSHAIINTGAIIEHECQIGEFTHIAVGAVICGGCNIGDDSFVGANSTVIQGVKIGMKSIIGAGSIILRDVPDNSKIVGIWK